MRATTCKIVLCVVVVVALFSTASCSNDSSSWYPSGAATAVSSYDTSVGGSPVCMITLKIENAGLAITDEYYQ